MIRLFAVSVVLASACASRSSSPPPGPDPGAYEAAQTRCIEEARAKRDRGELTNDEARAESSACRERVRASRYADGGAP